nr:immunoglobulin heavy chain junction region [Macaca mulatta]MOW99117.1 immunoglobulin heavy chain junction region [Macaca mulatta]MOW99159.1 immunoglobulin heavy chain junction region [Macaca mulatta]MOW99615.1 immunoglobulin heavy chain junction region [Macaca mulatta]MOW99844.1 immunoglobulin heavy chain junction region [Macaca mulatta]
CTKLPDNYFFDAW